MQGDLRAIGPLKRRCEGRAGLAELRARFRASWWPYRPHGRVGQLPYVVLIKAADPTAKFNATGNITGARILFYPGKALQGSKANVSFAHVKDITNVATGENGGGSDSESPDEI